jgi:2-keto-4-pentenoate hydratase/2-oxohepta-3-ene-1,7-dioic acid hydratase in catechol pathway
VTPLPTLPKHARLTPPIGRVGIVRVIDAWSRLQPKISDAARTAVAIPLADVRLETPIPWPNKLLALPSNLKDHADEMAGRPYAVSGSDNTACLIDVMMRGKEESVMR